MPLNVNILVLRKSKKLLETRYFLAGNILSKSACEKDLGVLVNSKLSWHDHIVNKVNKANKVLRLIRRTCGVHGDTDFLLSKSFIFILLDLIWDMLYKSGLRIRPI